MSPRRRELLQDLFSNSLSACDELMSHGAVSVPQIDGIFRQQLPPQVTMTEWLCVLTREGLLQSDSVQTAQEAIAPITVYGSEAWRTSSRRLVLVFRVLTADPGRHHPIRQRTSGDMCPKTSPRTPRESRPPIPA